MKAYRNHGNALLQNTTPPKQTNQQTKNNWISARMANFVVFSLPWCHLLLLRSVVILKTTVHDTGTGISQYQRELKRSYPQAIVTVCFDLPVCSLENWLKGLALSGASPSAEVETTGPLKTFRGRWVSCWCLRQ